METPKSLKHARKSDYLLQQALGAVRRHPRGHVEYHLGERRSEVRRRDPRGLARHQSPEEARVRLELYLPGQPGDEALVLPAGRGVAQYRVLVLLAGPHVDHRHLVGLPRPLAVQVPQLAQQLLVLREQMQLAPLLPAGQAQVREQQSAVMEGGRRRLTARPGHGCGAHTGVVGPAADVLALGVALAQDRRDRLGLEVLLALGRARRRVERGLRVRQDLGARVADVLEQLR